MDYQGIKNYAEECLRDTPPPCVTACPLCVDVRGLVSKVQTGKLASALRVYREAVLFPRVVSGFCEAPCRSACVREFLSDGFVDLSAIEQEVVAGAQGREVSRYAIPKRTERIAVLGAGLAGLACAYRLASKGFNVTVYREAEEDAVLYGEALALDKEELFKHIDCEWRDVTEIQADAEYDALFDSSNEIIGVAEQIASGLDIAAQIEQYFKLGELSRESAAPRSLSEASKWTVKRREQLPCAEKFYSLNYSFAMDAKTEAERCPMCNCSACIDACPMIRSFKQNPKRMAADLGVSVMPVGGKIKRVASRMMNSCNLCGLCTAVCPVGVDTKAAIEASRRILKETGHMAPVYHDYWMEDFSHAMSDEAYGIISQTEAPKILFFPGCQLTASLPETVIRTYEYVCETSPGAAMLLGCCGIPALWAAETEVYEEAIQKLRSDWERLGKPEVLFACSACCKTFTEALPEIQGRLIYEWIADNDGGVSWTETGGECPGKPAAVFDPCNSRNDKNGQKAVRKLAEGLGYTLEELSLSGEAAGCCGFGAHIYPANPAVLKAVLDERASDRPELMRLTYCANCRDMFLYKGMEPVHILELLFSGEAQKTSPALTERRANRVMLKEHYTSLKTGQRPVAFFGSINIPAGIEAKMGKLLLLREDVEKTITRCEETGMIIKSSEKERYLAHHRERLVTVWVEYERTDEGNYTVLNVYSHRMKIENETVKPCGDCTLPFGSAETRFSYLGHEFSHQVPGCGKCGQVFISEDLAAGKISEVETMLEDK